jgi:hypothetical protein
LSEKAVQQKAVQPKKDNMPKVKLNLRGQSVPEKIQFGRNVIKAMTGNANFTQPAPTLVELGAAVDALEAANNDAQNTRQQAQAKTVVVGTKEDALDKLLTRLGHYIEDTTGGDEAKIHSAGLDVQGDRAPVGPMPQVQNLIATTGDDEGEIDLAWDAVPGAASYEVQRGTDPNQPGTWVAAASGTASKATLESLPSGTRLWFRVRAVGAAGPGPWSDPAVKVVP